MSPDGPEDGLNRPEFRGRFEATVEHERRILTVPGDDVFPRLGQPSWGRCAKEVTERGLAKPVEMFMDAHEYRRLVELYARFLKNLADRCFADTLACFDSTGG